MMVWLPVDGYFGLKPLQVSEGQSEEERSKQQERRRIEISEGLCKIIGGTINVAY